MSGFPKTDVYFVRGRATLVHDRHSWGAITKLLLPKIDKWREESDSNGGDKSECAKTFLYEILPWLVEVLVQDGIYFTMDFPDHPLSHLLRVS